MKTVEPLKMNKVELFNDILEDLISAVNTTEEDHSVFGLGDYEAPIDEVNVGDVFTNKDGDEFEVLNFLNTDEVEVVFIKSNTEMVATVKQVLNGTVYDFMKPSVYGIGYFGSKLEKGYTFTREYRLWRSMLERCYSESYQKIAPTYEGCTVHPDWHNFTTFCNDLSSIPGYEQWVSMDKYELDKDTLIEGNREYSLITCQFIHESDNIRDAVKRRWNKVKEASNG